MSDNLISTPPAALRFKRDVFLSFRGEDTRETIVKNLYDSLEKHGVRAFMDEEGMSQGDHIAPKLLEAIEDSAASIIVVSVRYADSHWCLEELSRICQLKRLIIPIFYQVNPSDFRGQKGPFEKDFRVHVERYGEEKVAKWREATKIVGGISGFVFENRSSNEQQLIQLLVKRVSTEMTRTVGLATYTVGLDYQTEKLIKMLNVKSNHIHVLGLHGMGGIGKTTLAKALYNKLIKHFEYRSFISNVREHAEEGGGLISLQNKLLADLSQNKMPPVYEFGAGITAIKGLLHEKRVLVVLDDVNDVRQLNALAGNRNWFGEGSRVIITTRNKDVLVEHLVNEPYEVRELDKSDALRLFSYHALRREKPTNDFVDLSNQIVSLTGGLPLSLEVFGSFMFHKRTTKEWEDALKKLQQIRPHELQDVLRISFDGLDEEEKCIFLDIACLFVKLYMTREEAIDILKGCGLRAETAINVLVAKSLLKIEADNTLWMHDQLRDMGREIVLHENIEEPSLRSRLWNYDEITRVLKLKKEARNVRGIVLDRKKNLVEDTSADESVCNTFLTSLNLISALANLKEKFIHLLFPRQGIEKKGEVMLDTSYFESMINLRLLEINHVKLGGRFKFFPADLRWLQWKHCPLKNLPSDFYPSQLAVLDLSESGIEQVWGWRRNKVASKLMVLNLRYCYNLAAIPDLSGYKALEKLDLEHCTRLTKLHKSLGNLRTLLHLNLRECFNLVEFPSELSGLKCLQSLTLSSCSNLKDLPQDIGSMNSLKELLLDKTAISELPQSIYRLTRLEKLSLNGCQSLEQLPNCLGNLISLVELSLNGTALEQLPGSIGSLSNLEKLSVMWCESLATIPESVGNLQFLNEISVNSSAIKELPNSIGLLSNLKLLSASRCHYLKELPHSIGGLSSVSELAIDGTSITSLPDEIGALKLMEKLDMNNCAKITELPEAIGSLLFLTTINLFRANITELPESIGKLENLVLLKLRECKKLQKLPASLGNLKSLHHLLMEKTDVTELPESFGMLSSLMILKMGKKPSESLSNQDKFITLPTSFPNLSLLEELDARAWRISGKIPDDFEKLSMLEMLDLGYNNFCRLPSSLRGLSLLKKLLLPHCEELKSLPPLPSSLEEVDISNCFALETLSDISNLESLNLLNLTNCEKVPAIPGLECLKSLARLYMSGCGACSLSVKQRLSKVCLRNMRNLSIPGSEIPEWFSQQIVNYSEQKNREIKAVIICAVFAVDHQIPDELRDELPVLPAIEAKLFKQNKALCNSTLHIMGVPRTDEDQMHLCRYPDCHPLVARVRDGYKLEVRAKDPPVIKGVQVKKCGIHVVLENDDDYEGNEESLDESQLSLSAKLAKFFNSMN